ncbi:hypothetical protein TWF970_009627 [Orbilia oligospora]|uniref:Uncharacterized protein n=1 Tax=Orbilia oligospora TaxID=2813651 RepID=A0A7C8RIN1_ORBOL|nr:hypothetical protein TWF970_009627 [Orbilia oligospora]
MASKPRGLKCILSHPDPEAVAGDVTGVPEVPLIRREGEFVYIRLNPEFDKWVLENERVLAAFNEEVNLFAETRAQICPLGINPNEPQTTFSGQLAPQTTPNSFGYLIFALKGEVENMLKLDVVGAATEGRKIPEWLRAVSKAWKLPPAEARDVMINRRRWLKEYVDTLQVHWETLDKINKKEFVDPLGFFPKPAPFGATLPDRISRMLVILRSVFGGLSQGPEGKTAMINLPTLKFKAGKWKKRSEMLRARVKDAELWREYAQKWELNDPDIVKILGHYRYFNLFETESWGAYRGVSLKRSLPVTLFDNIWAWYGCWSAAWNRIVTIIDQLTPLPGLEDVNLEWAPEGQPYTTKDTITLEELMSDVPHDPKLTKLYMESLLMAPHEDLATIPIPDNQAQFRIQPRPQFNMQDLVEAPENSYVAPISTTQTETQPQAQAQQGIKIEPQSEAQLQEVQVQPEVQIQPEVQVQPEVQIQEESEQGRMLIEFEPNQGDTSATNNEPIDISDLSSHRSRPGGKSRARMNRKPKNQDQQMEEEL